MFLRNTDGFRNLGPRGAPEVPAPGFFRHVASSPRASNWRILPAQKVGIRASFVDRKTRKFVMDFLTRTDRAPRTS